VEKPFNFRKLLTDAAIPLAVISFYGYFIAYFFEYGYLRYFNIPPYYINISLTNIFDSIYGTLDDFMLIFILGFIYTVNRFLGSQLSKLSKLFILVIILLGVVIGLAFAEFDLEHPNSLLLISLFFVFATIEMFRNIYSIQSKKKHKEVENETHKYFVSFRNKGLIIFPLLVTQLAIIYLATSAGSHKASRENKFHTLHYENRDFIVIREYNDRLLAVPFDTRKKTFSRQIFLINNSRLAEENIPLTFAEFCPLRPE
jgi:hypothetical protein